MASIRFLKSVFKDDTVNELLTGKGCEWTFNIEKVPWWGGALECLVRSTKLCLRKMVGQASLTHDDLLTVMMEIESIINSRPLSYIHVSAEDTEEPLTPSHLLIGRRVLNLPDHLDHLCDPGDEDFDLDATQLTKRMKYFSCILDHCWRRWRNEYFAELRESHKRLWGWAHKGPRACVREVVIVHDEGLPGSFWKLSRIKKLIVGKDGQMRGAAVRVASKGRSHVTLSRPLQLLHVYPLEINHPPDPKTDHPNLLNSPGDIGLKSVPGETDHSDVSAKP